ncbi:MAG: hypothetical protein MUE96_06400 [Bacteroidia bacterium]|nr:hypothetical protein [Bacteroidia bacterium]
MKKITLFLFISISAAVCNQTFAQMNKDEVQLVQSIWGMEKRAIITEYMKFTEAEITKFAPIYEEYAKAYKSLGEARLQIISEYANSFTTMTNEQADVLMQKYLKNNADIDKLQLLYYNKIKKEISALRAAAWMQLEIYLQTMIRAELQSALPMIGELDQRIQH